MTVQQFTDYVKKMQHYEEALNVIYWDMRTGAPKKGLAQRSEVIGTLSASLFDMQTSEELGELLAALEAQKADLDYVTLRLVEEVRKNYDQNKKIPANEYKEFVILQSKAETAWEEAKATNNFALFLPYLEEIIQWQKNSFNIGALKMDLHTIHY